MMKEMIDCSAAQELIDDYIISLLNLQQTRQQMPGRYDTNPAEISAVGFPIYPESDDYVLEIGEPKAREFNTKAGVKAGINWPLRIVESPSHPELKGKMTSFFGDELNDIGKQQNKRLLMAAAGLEVNEANDKKYSESINGQDFSFNTADGVCGQGWLPAKGKVVGASLGINVGKEGENQGKQYQSFKSFKPYPPVSK